MKRWTCVECWRVFFAWWERPYCSPTCERVARARREGDCGGRQRRGRPHGRSEGVSAGTTNPATSGPVQRADSHDPTPEADTMPRRDSGGLL
jgi:hypothetical protein